MSGDTLLTWLQPVQFRSGKPGLPRSVHLRRVMYQQDARRREVRSVAVASLCNAKELIPAQGPPTCPKCIRIAGPDYRPEKWKEHA